MFTLFNQHDISIYNRKQNCSPAAILNDKETNEHTKTLSNEFSERTNWSAKYWTNGCSTYVFILLSSLSLTPNCHFALLLCFPSKTKRKDKMHDKCKTLFLFRWFVRCAAVTRKWTQIWQHLGNAYNMVEQKRIARQRWIRWCCWVFRMEWDGIIRKW